MAVSKLAQETLKVYTKWGLLRMVLTYTNTPRRTKYGVLSAVSLYKWHSLETN